jgi:hypothetical protein
LPISAPTNAKKAKRELGLFLQPQIISASTSVVADDDRVKSCSLELLGGHLAGPAVAGDLEAELLAFLQIAHTCALDCGDVYEHILAAVVRLNEAETLGGIEPFNDAGGHEEPSLLANSVARRRLPTGSERFRKGEFVRSAPERVIKKTAVQAISMNVLYAAIEDLSIDPTQGKSSDDRHKKSKAAISIGILRRLSVKTA